MSNNQVKHNFIAETSDYLEAVGVCRGWKNFLFVVVLLCLLILQLSFWLVDRGCIKSQDKGETPKVEPTIVKPPEAKDLVTPLKGSQTNQAGDTTNEIEKAAKISHIKDQTNSSDESPRTSKAGSFFSIKLEHINWIIRFCNFVLILAAILYCLALIFGFEVSLVGRLGGIKNICRAFFLSLVMVVLLLPWQLIFGKIVLGAIYTTDELISRCADRPNGIFSITFHYLRFTGYWVLILLLLILSHLRSSRWTKAILRRLEIM
jgi:hypothetical protein